jgi:hypothetical protein
MAKSDPILLFVASQVAPRSLAAYMQSAVLRLNKQTTLSAVHASVTSH